MQDYSTVATTGGPAPMGNNGKTVSGAGPNVSGPAMAKPESKGPKARDQGDLTPKSVA